MVSSILTTTLSASSDSDFRPLTAYRFGAETPSPPMIFLLSPTLAESARTLPAWDVCRGTTGDEYCNGVAGGWYFFGFSSRPSRFQFEITALTAICSLAVGALSSCSGPRDYYLPWMRLWAGRLDARLSPGHHSRVIVLCFIMVMSSEFHIIALRTNKSCQKRRVVIQWPTAVTRGRVLNDKYC